MTRSLAVVGALLGLATSASAYNVMTTPGGLELRWTALPMKFTIHQAAANGVSASATQSAIRASYTTWSSVSCSYFTSKDLGVVNLPQGDENDNINTHSFLSSWPSSYDNNALGITWTHYDASSGKIFDADAHYNPKYTWSTTGSLSAIDVQSVVTHEIGHQLGLDHSNDQNATMFYATGNGDTSQRSLAADDLAGLCHLYPTGSTPPPECTTPAQCALNETCQNQKCVPAGQKGYGGTCSSGKDCTSGLCLESGGNTFCSQACGTGNTCPNGDQCVPVTGGGITDACLPNSANLNTKTLGQTCSSPSECKSLLCVSVPGKGNLCSEQCDPTKQLCPTGYQCAKSSGAMGLCIPGTPTPPPTKKAIGEPCTLSSDCTSDLCITASGAKVCSQLCTTAKPCPTGYTCTPAGTSSVCIKTVAPTPTKKELGEACTGNVQCKSNICASIGGKQLCTQMCDPAAGCPGEFDCSPAGAQNVCTPREPEIPEEEGSSGCAYTLPPVPPPWVLPLLFVLPLLLIRRRR
jgi:hypothetical protein